MARPAPPHLALATLLAVASAASSASCKHKPQTKVIVGVQSDPMGGVVKALHVVIKVAGAVAIDERVEPPKGSMVGFPQPFERELSGEGKGEAPIDVSVEAFGDGGRLLLTRLASTTFVPGKTSLLRVPLEARCVVYPPPPPDAKVPGPISGPACTAPATCIAGMCQTGKVPPQALEAYAKNWPTNAPDRCKQRGGGPPALQLGTGQSYYLPLQPNQTLTAEAGPQGGHHVWLATRMHNLRQSGTITKIQGVQPGTNVAIPPTTLVYTYGPDEGGFCKLTGIRYQLDNEGIDYKQFLGKPLDLTVTLTDPSGVTITKTAHVQIAPNLLGQ